MGAASATVNWEFLGCADSSWVSRRGPGASCLSHRLIAQDVAAEKKV